MQSATQTAFQVDLKEAVSCFESMGFEVVVERNLHYVDMMRLLSRVAQMDHSDSDCLVVALLSHGNDGSVYAYDAAFPTQVDTTDNNQRKIPPKSAILQHV